MSLRTFAASHLPGALGKRLVDDRHPKDAASSSPSRVPLSGPQAAFVTEMLARHRAGVTKVDGRGPRCFEAPSKTSFFSNFSSDRLAELELQMSKRKGIPLFRHQSIGSFKPSMAAARALQHATPEQFDQRLRALQDELVRYLTPKRQQRLEKPSGHLLSPAQEATRARAMVANRMLQDVRHLTQHRIEEQHSARYSEVPSVRAEHMTAYAAAMGKEFGVSEAVTGQGLKLIHQADGGVAASFKPLKTPDPGSADRTRRAPDPAPAALMRHALCDAANAFMARQAKMDFGFPMVAFSRVDQTPGALIEGSPGRCFDLRALRARHAAGLMDLDNVPRTVRRWNHELHSVPAPALQRAMLGNLAMGNTKLSWDQVTLDEHRNCRLKGGDDAFPAPSDLHQRDLRRGEGLCKDLNGKPLAAASAPMDASVRKSFLAIDADALQTHLHHQRDELQRAMWHAERPAVSGDIAPTPDTQDGPVSQAAIDHTCDQIRALQQQLRKQPDISLTALAQWNQSRLAALAQSLEPSAAPASSATALHKAASPTVQPGFSSVDAHAASSMSIPVQTPASAVVSQKNWSYATPVRRPPSTLGLVPSAIARHLTDGFGSEPRPLRERPPMARALSSSSSSSTSSSGSPSSSSSSGRGSADEPTTPAAERGVPPFDLEAWEPWETAQWSAAPRGSIGSRSTASTSSTTSTDSGTSVEAFEVDADAIRGDDLRSSGSPRSERRTPSPPAAPRATSTPVGSGTRTLPATKEATLQSPPPPPASGRWVGESGPVIRTPSARQAGGIDIQRSNAILLTAAVDYIRQKGSWANLGGELAPMVITEMPSWPKKRPLQLVHGDTGRTLARFPENSLGKPVLLVRDPQREHYMPVVNRQRIEVAADGDCFYRAVLKGLGEDAPLFRQAIGLPAHASEDEAVARLRQRLADHVEHERHRYEPMMSNLAAANEIQEMTI